VSQIEDTVTGWSRAESQLEHSPQPKQRSSIVTTTFNTEMSNQNRELTADELEAVAGGMIPAILAGLFGIGFMAGAGMFDGVGSAIDVKGAIARGHW
jgi:lactobin A/cerein 7B family class IIb bacteriocin